MNATSCIDGPAKRRARPVLQPGRAGFTVEMVSPAEPTLAAEPWMLLDPERALLRSGRVARLRAPPGSGA